MPSPKMYPLNEALKAQRAMRDASGLGLRCFRWRHLSMISNETEYLRNRGKSDEEIAAIIRGSSAIEIE